MALRFTLRQLEYLVAVGDAGSIAGAAARINVSSPSISTAITQLEGEFGVQLFVRKHAHGLSLTPGGQRIFNRAKEILGSAANLHDLAGEIAHRASGPLAVGCFLTLAPLISANLRASFQAIYPDANVTLREGHQSNLLNMLRRAEIEIAITYDLEIPKDIDFMPLAALPTFAMLHPSHAKATASSVTMQELHHDPFVLLDLPMSRDYFHSLFYAENLRPSVGDRSSLPAVVRALVANGAGFSLVNARGKGDFAPDGRPLAFVPLAGIRHPIQVGLATMKSVNKARVLQAFLDHASQEVPRLIDLT